MRVTIRGRRAWQKVWIVGVQVRSESVTDHLSLSSPLRPLRPLSSPIRRFGLLRLSLYRDSRTREETSDTAAVPTWTVGYGYWTIDAHTHTRTHARAHTHTHTHTHTRPHTHTHAHTHMHNPSCFISHREVREQNVLVISIYDLAIHTENTSTEARLTLVC